MYKSPSLLKIGLGSSLQLHYCKEKQYNSLKIVSQSYTPSSLRSSLCTDLSMNDARADEMNVQPSYLTNPQVASVCAGIYPAAVEDTDAFMDRVAG